MIDIQTFYNEHPINEFEILSKVEARGKSLDALSPSDLYPYDQDHYGGLAANDALATALSISSHSHVLDLCSGMGGPARYLAAKYGCRVHGVELNSSRIVGARKLTELVGLATQVTFSQGNASDLALDLEGFDVAISQEAFLHIPQKEALLAGIFRVLAPSGRLGFTDWTASPTLTATHRTRFVETFAAQRILGQKEYCDILDAAGFKEIEVIDLSANWRVLLHERLEMFRSLEAETVARFGQERHNTYIRNYEFFVACIDGGDLGGSRFVAHINSS
ncbi:MAG: methyltransferase domain-containing protein [Chloroflexota bacterium]